MIVFRPNRALLKEAKKVSKSSGNHKRLQSLINSGAHVNTMDEHGNTPLHLASLNGNEQFVNILIQNGADVNSVNNDDYTALYYAVQSDNDNIIGLLLPRYFSIANGMDIWLPGPEVNFSAHNYSTPITAAAGDGLCECIQTLIKVGADVNKAD